MLILVGEIAIGSIISHKILRNDRTDGKKSLRLFIVFYFVPFTLAGCYFQTLKIFDYAIIFGSYWFLLNSRHFLSSFLLSLAIYHNPLYADLVLVPALWLKSKGEVSSWRKYVATTAVFWAGFNLASMLANTLFVRTGIYFE